MSSFKTSWNVTELMRDVCILQRDVCKTDTESAVCLCSEEVGQCAEGQCVVFTSDSHGGAYSISDHHPPTSERSQDHCGPICDIRKERCGQIQDDMHFTFIMKYATENQALMTTMLTAVQQLVTVIVFAC